MDSHDKIRRENGYTFWGFYLFHARRTMSSMELLEMSIILKRTNPACGDMCWSYCLCSFDVTLLLFIRLVSLPISEFAAISTDPDLKFITMETLFLISLYNKCFHHSYLYMWGKKILVENLFFKRFFFHAFSL